MDSDIEDRARRWVRGGDTGVSSLTICEVMTGWPVHRADIPYDPDDFGRCHRLLLLIPEWAPRLQEVADAYPKWQPFVDVWDRMVALWGEESPKLYDLMCDIRGIPERNVTVINSGRFGATR